MPFAHHSIRNTSRAASTFLLSAAWLVLSLAASGQLARLASVQHLDLTRQVLCAALLFSGFYVAAKLYLTDLRPLSNVGFVRRPGIGGEFARGLALGWGIAIALVLPALLTGNLNMTFALTGANLFGMIEGVAILIAFALVVQMVLAGLPVRTLLKATGQTMTVLAVLLVLALLAIVSAGQGRSILVTILAGCLFVTAFLRTRAIWLPLGLQIGWTIGLQILFGTPSQYTPPTFGIVSSAIGGPQWLTGSLYGPETTAVAILILAAAYVVLFRLTKDYAWHYTWQPLEGAGRAVDIAPPAEHLREEAKRATPLVQIGGIQSAPPADRP